MEIIHKDMVKGRWFKMSLCEQLGNIGSEVHRALRWQGKDKKSFDSAVDRALDLFELTFMDSRWKGRLREIARAREVFCDAVNGGEEYNSSLEDLDKYFFQYALCARLNM